ncbi:type II toxin-antitoxin system PemK/MazF family toxin [Isoptericola sp. NEAU-Y5]|uniref:Type II toxin-antitoxin system PemK/MazF family toxin n=1 Tax=Isoptericola luteus TaxID=2879484 RepID=A0ABS7ZIM1_9MICO|nr:type II toxin-antitoxin system PemK/MazF family toxin [Isoptericola sp. NEAU-Y5]MCA5894873.1 type II toxin-antitoxin system PemK/MazF family toxin [Isoptericola sp. NEAU-Y5]
MANRWLNLLVDVLRSTTSRRTPRSRTRASTPGTPQAPATRGTTKPAPQPTRRPAPTARTTRPATSATYPGDFRGTVTPAYAPRLDGDPDPGEIVWTWVPYEEDHSQGKDRPVLLVGHDGPWLLALQLTSKDHDQDAAQEARYGRLWMDIGTGPWDSRGRASEVRINRVIRVDPAKVRREGAVMDRRTFDRVAAAMVKARSLR